MEVFISYRRGDGGWAGRLYADLVENFATFFDEQIQPGEPWPERIERAARGCTVMLVAIGPDWVKDANLKRLHDPSDWVRQELDVAFERSGSVRVVPILVGRASLPDAARLPASLRDLPRRQKHDINHWESDVGALTDLLFSWLSGRATGRAAQASFPPILPYLCDRIEQQDGLEDLITASAGQGVFACVVHGEAVDGHDGFVERVLHEQLFERVFAAQATSVAVPRLNLNQEYVRRGEYGLALRRALQRALGTASASESDLLPLLLAPGRPQIMVLQVASTDYKDSGPVAGLVDAWFGLFGNPRRQPSRPLLLWVNLVGPEPADSVWPAPKAVRALLPRLEPLREGHILEWIARPTVKRHVAGREARLLRISSAHGAVPMLHFAEAVGQILAAR